MFSGAAMLVAVLCLGWYFSSSWMELAGIILFGHSSLDRVLGCGLKYPDSFHHPHLSRLRLGAAS